MKKILLTTLILFLAFGYVPFRVLGQSTVLIEELKAQISNKEEEIKKLEEQAAAYKKELETTQNQKNTLKNQISLIEGRVKKLQNDISITSARIENASLKIDGLSLDISEKQNEIDKKKDSIASVMQVLYEYDQASLVEIVLTKTTFSDLMDQIHYLESLQNEVYKNLVAYQELKKEMESRKSETERQRNELYSLQNQLSSQKQVVAKEKEEKNYLLTKTKGQEKQYQSLLDDTLKKQQEIQQSIYELEDKLQLAYDPNSLPESRSGVLDWPLGGVLTQKYGYTAYSKKLYSSGFHNGIDISSSYGEPIKAALNGTITAIGNCGRYAYGKWIAVKHENALTTLYGHLSGYGAFKVGDKVKTGDIIGYEGSTGYSTGAHLHFGVYVAQTFRVESMWYGLLPIGAHLDPMKYL
jgi:murein DD-endopeptidase MepM/ murein hydrolase activator NlpD